MRVAVKGSAFPFVLLRFVAAAAALAALIALLTLAGPAEAVAETEPNNDALHAQPIALGAELDGSSTSGDIDWFVLTVPGPGLIDVSLTGGAPAAGFYNSTLEPIPSTRLTQTGYPVFYGVVVSGPTSLFVQLTPYGPYDYTFIANFTAGFAGVQGVGETEYNSAPENATALPLDATVDGLLSARY